MMRWIWVVVWVGCGQFEGTGPEPPRALEPQESGDTDDAPEVPEPPCVVTSERVVCAHDERRLTVAGIERQVLFATPQGPPPDAGWPAVIGFQGSFTPPIYSWEAEESDAYGVYTQALVTQALLEAGYAVITPAALGEGETAWQTNLPPCNALWSGCADDQLMQRLFVEIDAGTFGSVNRSELYALGLSSGGYMTSRMALSYTSRFRALAIMSASWATCIGAFCVVPPSLPDGHPPTLLMHGERDTVVPLWTTELYVSALQRDGVSHRLVTEPTLGHAWMSTAPAEVVAWFGAH